MQGGRRGYWTGGGARGEQAAQSGRRDVERTARLGVSDGVGGGRGCGVRGQDIMRKGEKRGKVDFKRTVGDD